MQKPKRVLWRRSNIDEFFEFFFRISLASACRRGGLSLYRKKTRDLFRDGEATNFWEQFREQ